MIVEILKKDVKKHIKSLKNPDYDYSTSCPIAKAVKRKLHKYVEIGDGEATIRVNKHGRFRSEYLTQEANTFIEAIDAGIEPNIKKLKVW